MRLSPALTLFFVSFCVLNGTHQALAQTPEQQEAHDEAHMAKMDEEMWREYALWAAQDAVGEKLDAEFARTDAVNAGATPECLQPGDVEYANGNIEYAAAQPSWNAAEQIDLSADIEIGVGDAKWADEDYAGAVTHYVKAKSLYESAASRYVDAMDRFLMAMDHYTAAESTFQMCEMEAEDGEMEP